MDLAAVLTMRRQGETVVRIRKHVLGIVQHGIRKETGTWHGVLILYQPGAFFADHAVPVPEKVPEADILLRRPAPQPLEIALPVHARAALHKGREFGDLT